MASPRFVVPRKIVKAPLAAATDGLKLMLTVINTLSAVEAGVMVVLRPTSVQSVDTISAEVVAVAELELISDTTIRFM